MSNLSHIREPVGTVAVVSVNFKTPALIEDCVESFVAHYPTVPYVLMDNGGCSTSLSVVRRLSAKYPHVTLVENGQNIGHGPALNRAIRQHVSTPYVFTLDSDTRVERGGFLELMLERFTSNSLLFALGWLRYVNENGVASPHQELKRGHPYVHPYASLLDRGKYLKLEPFIHTGAPATRLMSSAIAAGYRLESFPIEQYIWHKVAGTRGQFRGQCKVPTDRKPEKWRLHRI